MARTRILSFTLLAALAGAAPGLAQAPETPAQILDRIDGRLLAWDTTGGRELFQTLPDTGSAAAKMAAGRLLQQEGKLDEAAAQLAAAMAAAPGDPSPAIHLGENHRLAGQTEDARQAFEEAARRATAGLESAPENVALLVDLGVAKQKLRQLPEAIAALQKARELAPGNVQAVYRLGVTQAMAHNWGTAVELLTEALNRNPDIAYAYYFRALSADKVDRKDLLINDLQRFLALAPHSPDAPRAQRLLDAL